MPSHGKTFGLGVCLFNKCSYLPPAISILVPIVIPKYFHITTGSFPDCSHLFPRSFPVLPPVCDIPTCFVTCRKSLCVAGAILLRCFQKMSFSFRGRRSTSDVPCCVFSANRSIRAARSGDKARPFMRCGENWRKPRTKHWFWDCRFWMILRFSSRENGFGAAN